MGNGIWSFIGVSKSNKSQADVILEKVFERFFLTVEHQMGLSYKEFEDLNHMIMVGEDQMDNPYRFFWTWLSKYGKVKLEEIGRKSIPDTDETLDYLEYRLFLLDTEEENGVIVGILDGLAETISEIHRYIDELAITVDWDTPVSEGWKPVNNEKWLYVGICRNPAEFQRDLCYYSQYKIEKIALTGSVLTL